VHWGSALGRAAGLPGILGRVELDWLETFLAVVDRGGFTAASEQLHRSQSRVSAHIAALERSLGVRLIDRARRPAALTTAGEVFARHARDIVAGVGSARSAVGALRGLDQGNVAVLTTPCIGAALFPGVLAQLTAELPGLRVELAEQSWHDLERRFLADGAAMAVLPSLVVPLAKGLQMQPLWWERLVAVVPREHELAGAAVPLERLVRHPLVVCGASGGGEPEVLRMLAARGVAAQLRVTVDSPHTLVALARAGVGVGIVNEVALATLDVTGFAVVDIDDPGLVREVSAYWCDVLLDTRIGRGLHRAVLDAPVPQGAKAACMAPDGRGGSASEALSRE
jgi:DNA-binding transcriptional LysR family regulator